jgi:HPt (histidine-containing phosphotransfer) domain-containing protein
MKTTKAADRTDSLNVRIDPELADLIPGFLENRESDVETIKKAVERGDFEEVRVLAHNMKGAGGGYGFETITEIGDALEQAAKQGDTDVILAQVAELSRYLDQVEVIYD